GARVCTFYGPASGCWALRLSENPINCHIDFAVDRFLDDEFACELKSAKPIQQIRDGLTQLKSPTTQAAAHEKEKLSGQLNAYYTSCGEGAAEKTMAWAQ